MPNAWEPDYWFLADNEQVKVKLREIGQEIPIDRNQLLWRRSYGWRYQNSDQNPYAWKMRDAEAELTIAYTSHNQVTALIDGKAFMSDLHKEIKNLCRDDFALIAGWEFWQYRSLDHRVSKGNIENDATFLPAVLQRAVANKVEVRVLAFGKGPPGCRDRTENFVEEVNKICKDSAFLTAPTNFAMSHHQKEVLLARSSFEDSRAYVGGIDLGIHRFDDSDHKEPAVEWGLKSRWPGNFGWHDIQVVVQGDAMVQLWANFAERWDDARNERKADLAHPGATGIDRRTLPSSDPTAGDLLPCPVPEWAKAGWKRRSPNIGNKYVQVLRTVGPRSRKESARKRFMPDGERTVLCALKKAIEKAECYIYIEEQFLWDCELADFIAERMHKPNSKLHLIIVMTAGCELPVKFKSYGFFLRDAFFRTVLRTTGNIEFGDTHKVYPYGLFQTKNDGHKEIYVHSKLIIIDDRYVAVGSANVDARSMHIETELTLGIVDGDTVTSTLGGTSRITVCKFAKELREKLWKEHLGVDVSNLDPIVALTLFPGVGGFGWPKNETEAIEQEKHHLRCYINVPGANLLRPWMRRFIDRNQRKWHAWK